jgi:hypothetical protein
MRIDEFAFENAARAVYIMNNSSKERYNSWQELHEFMLNMASQYQFGTVTSMSTGGFQLSFTRSPDNLDVYVTASVSAYVALLFASWVEDEFKTIAA